MLVRTNIAPKRMNGFTVAYNNGDRMIVSRKANGKFDIYRNSVMSSPVIEGLTAKEAYKFAMYILRCTNELSCTITRY